MSLIFRTRGWQPLRRLAVRSFSCLRPGDLPTQPVRNFVKAHPDSAILQANSRSPFSVRRLTSTGVDLGSKDETAKPAKDNLLTVPNALCVSRIAMAPYLAHLIIEGDYTWALGLFAYAGITDLLDGWIARNFEGQASMVGSFLDPLADKILVTTLYLTLTYVNLVPVELASLVVSRDIFLVYAGFYVRYMSIPPPFTLAKYFDLSIPTAQVNPTTISKINTMVQLAMVGSALSAAALQIHPEHPALTGLCYLTAGTTLASAASYAFMKDTYKFTHREYDHQFGKKLFAFVLFLAINAGVVYVMPSREKSKEKA